MSRPTRGHGLLEGRLARWRVRQASRLVPSSHARGRVLDIGCGSYPLFLASTAFAEKYGVDRVPITRPETVAGKLTLHHHDVGREPELPFESGFFDVVTALAVYEHLAAAPRARLLAEIHRVLRPGGIFVMTTPAAWTGPILKVLANTGMVSAEELDEHQGSFGGSHIRTELEGAGFAAEAIRTGFFELGMNSWATATA